MRNEQGTEKPRRGSKMKKVLAAVAASAVLIFGGALPAHAVADQCGGGAGFCGIIKNDGAINITATTDYRTPTSVATGAKKATVKPGNKTPALYDWDAVWVPNGYCAKINGGPLWNSGGITNNISRSSATSAGTWAKVDNWGASVKLKKGSCPS